MAALSHQGHRARARSLGSEMGGVLAEGEQRPAGASALLDRGARRVDERGEILRVEPGAGAAWHHVATVAACGLSTLVGGELFSPGQSEPPVLCPDVAEIRGRD